MTATRERERVVLPKDWTFDLSEEMVDRIKDEFDPDATVEQLAARIEGKPLDEAEAIARAFFADYGTRWMGRTLELGEQYADRTYQVLRAAAEKTGEMAFPFIPERFVEIAYLSTQPIYSLPIVENTRTAFRYKMVFCGTHESLRDRCGGDLAERLPCAEGCLAAAGLAFTAKGFDVDVSQDASLATGEFCQFSVVPR
jgi:hypothetical protein